MKTYLLSNINIDSLKYYLKDHDIQGSCSYGNYLIDLIDTNSGLYSSDVELVIFFLDGEALKESNNLDEILKAVENFLSRRSITFILSNIVLNPNYIDTYLNRSNQFELKCNQEILNFVEKENILLLDFHRIVLKYGYAQLHDNRFWYLAKIRQSKLGFETIAQDVNMLLNAYRGKMKKVLVVDLDNTLWSGVVGEGGDEDVTRAITLSHEGEGKIYRDFQAALLELKKLGVLLAINSKNNYDDAIAGLNHPHSLLKEEDFIIIKANWENKVSNLQAIANELNVGIDSLLFIDDNAVERDLVKEYLPEVSVPEFPQEMSNYTEWFIEDVVYPYFSKYTLTKEDDAKHEQYRANIKRNSLASNTLNLEDFITALEIKLTCFIDDRRFIERYAQMSQKTNQFNLTTKRYTTKDIEKFLDDDNSHIFAIDYADKFLSEGIIGLAIVTIEGDSAHIDTLLLSCRVLKRGVEAFLFDQIAKKLKTLNIKQLHGYYYPTKKNILVKELYKEYNFKNIDENHFIKDL